MGTIKSKVVRTEAKNDSGLVPSRDSGSSNPDASLLSSTLPNVPGGPGGSTKPLSWKQECAANAERNIRILLEQGFSCDDSVFRMRITGLEASQRWPGGALSWDMWPERFASEMAALWEMQDRESSANDAYYWAKVEVNQITVVSPQECVDLLHDLESGDPAFVFMVFRKEARGPVLCVTKKRHAKTC